MYIVINLILAHRRSNSQTPHDHSMYCLPGKTIPCETILFNRNIMSGTVRHHCKYMYKQTSCYMLATIISELHVQASTTNAGYDIASTKQVYCHCKMSGWLHKVSHLWIYWAIFILTIAWKTHCCACLNTDIRSKKRGVVARTRVA